MIKLVLFDVDGVVIKSRGKFFSQRLAEKQGLPIEEVMPFFTGDYKLCATGLADLKEVLPRYFETWKWQGTVEDLMNFWFEGEKDTDPEVINIVETLRSKNILCGLASDNEKYRIEYLMKEVELENHFNVHNFFSAGVGFKKSNPEFFNKILEATSFKPEEIQYWDDDQKNVDIAKSLGIDAHLFTSANEMKKEIENYV